MKEGKNFVFCVDDKKSQISQVVSGARSTTTEIVLNGWTMRDRTIPVLEFVQGACYNIKNKLGDDSMKKAFFALTLAALSLLCGCHEHSWTEATCLVPATCTECGKVEDETLADHTWVDATCSTPKTCSVCALTEGEPLAHTWIEANCGAPKTCSTCNLIEGEPVGEHIWTEATCEAPRTCTVCGSTEGQKLRHESSPATCTEPRICIHCGITVGEPLDHQWAEATCYIGRTCRRCGFMESETLEHNFVNNVCTLCGYYVRPSVHPNAAYAKYFGIDPNIKWIENADTQEEIVNNIAWNALNGDFSFDWIGNTPYCNSEDVFITIDATINVYADLMGAYINAVRSRGQRGSNFHVAYDAYPLPMTEEEAFNQTLLALDKAQSISKKLHNNGTITDDMSELEIVKVYYNYLNKNDYRQSAPDGNALLGTGKNMFYDTAYACLFNKNANCGGRAAAFNLFMHIEGISAQGVDGNTVPGDRGHKVSRVIADGKEYFVDWGNNKPISTYEQACKWINFYAGKDEGTSLKIARQLG